MDEEFALKIMWVILAQLGVHIDMIQDNRVIDFSVPSMSDYTAQPDIGALGVEGVPQGEMLAGELLLQIANSFFEENGFKTNGRIRQEYWNEMMGQFAADKMQREIEME